MTLSVIRVRAHTWPYISMALIGRASSLHLAGRQVEGKVNAGPEDIPLAEVPGLSLYHLSL